MIKYRTDLIVSSVFPQVEELEISELGVDLCIRALHYHSRFSALDVQSPDQACLILQRQRYLSQVRSKFQVDCVNSSSLLFHCIKNKCF